MKKDQIEMWYTQNILSVITGHRSDDIFDIKSVIHIYPLENTAENLRLLLFD